MTQQNRLHLLPILHRDNTSPHSNTSAHIPSVPTCNRQWCKRKRALRLRVHALLLRPRRLPLRHLQRGLTSAAVMRFRTCHLRFYRV
jgi:hypothetical protein